MFPKKLVFSFSKNVMMWFTNSLTRLLNYISEVGCCHFFKWLNCCRILMDLDCLSFFFFPSLHVIQDWLTGVEIRSLCGLYRLLENSLFSQKSHTILQWQTMFGNLHYLLTHNSYIKKYLNTTKISINISNNILSCQKPMHNLIYER